LGQCDTIFSVFGFLIALFNDGRSQIIICNVSCIAIAFFIKLMNKIVGQVSAPSALPSTVKVYRFGNVRMTVSR
jgi:hypothetical protein